MKLVAIGLLFASLACAQKIVAARAGLVYYAEGTFNVDGKLARASSRNHALQLNEGEVASSPRGHAEILLGPNAVLWTGTLAQIRIDDSRVENTVVAVIEGSAIIEIKHALEPSRLEIDLGTLNIDLAREGVYRFDSASKTVRVYAGEVSLPGAVKLLRGTESVDGIVRLFDRRDLDEFHYWASCRSFLLEGEAGVYKHWSGERGGERAHSGFGVKFPETPGAARMKYQAASEAGLLYYLDGNAIISGLNRPGPVQLPIRLGRERFLRTEEGRAEIFLGVGVILRMGNNSFVRVLDTRSFNPVVALDEGTAMIEVANTEEGTPLRVHVGDSVTDLLKPGLYLFDVTAKTLRVFGGETSTSLIKLTSPAIRAKETQVVDLEKIAPVTKFDTRIHDELFDWSAKRSFALFLTPAAFMTPWEPSALLGRYKHKQFGDRKGPYPRRQLPRF